MSTFPCTTTTTAAAAAATAGSQIDQVLHALRLRHVPNPTWFNLDPLDELLRTIRETQPSPAEDAPPILELTSMSPGGGKTHLLYHLTALAVLPRRYGGRQSCVAIIDADGTFCVARQAQQLRHHITAQSTRLDESNPDGSKPNESKPNESKTASESKPDIESIILSALTHIHLLRPQSLGSTIASLAALPAYLLNSAHSSLDRSLAFVALDSACAFYWQARAEQEDAAFAVSTRDGGADDGDDDGADNNTGVDSVASNAPPATYAGLSAAVKNVVAALRCPFVFTSWHIGPPSTAANAAANSGRGGGGSSSTIRHGDMYHIGNVPRPSLPAPFAQLPTLRLLVRRADVRRFPAAMSGLEARREAGDRLAVVRRGRFECVADEVGVAARVARRVRELAGGLGFRITEEGVRMERDGREEAEG